MKNGLVLSGAGGAIGFLVGALTRVNREHQKVVGVSSGALVGIMYATGNLRRLYSLLTHITDEEVAKKRVFRYIRRHVYHLVGVKKPLMGIYDNKPLRKLLRRELIGQTVDIDFTAVSVNVKTGDEKWFTIEKGTTFTEKNINKYVSQIISSTAIPGVFPPEKIDGQLYIDGGISTHTPIRPLKALLPEADHITIISTATGEKARVEEVVTDFDYLPGRLSDLIKIVPTKDFFEFEYKNKLAKAGHSDYTYYPSLIIRPDQELAPTVRFHHSYMIPDYYHGMDRASRALRKGVVES